eukprot:c1778_g1_i1.p1 GENE.c1778_g1_i1~~c1778_g1_i1.p1  ORF type:complete len:358 (+),score=79.13 c1778_g1_i1:67-1140(+)
MSYNDDILMDGWLRKQSQAMKIWQPRWFVLTKYNLKYYHNPQEARASGLMAIENVEVMREDGVAFSRKPTTNSQIFYVKHPSRSYALSAETVTQAQEWMDAIHRAARGLPMNGGEPVDEKTAPWQNATAGFRTTSRPELPPRPAQERPPSPKGPIPSRQEPKVEMLLFDDSPSTPIPTAPVMQSQPAQSANSLWDWQTPATPTPALTPSTQSNILSQFATPAPTQQNYDLMGSGTQQDPTKLKHDILAMYAQQPARPGFSSGGFRPSAGVPGTVPIGVGLGTAFGPGLGVTTTQAANMFASTPANSAAVLTPVPLVAGGMKPLIPDNELLGQRKRPLAQPQQTHKNVIDIDPFAQFK